MLKQMRVSALLLSLTYISTGIGGCSSIANVKENTPSTVGTETKSAASQANATFVTEVAFNEGSDALTNGSQQNLTDLISRAKSTGQIDEVKIVSWADREYPAEAAKKLAKQERDLANNRNTRIKDFLKNVDRSLDIDAVNMAERPGTLSKLFNTDSAKIKKSLEVAGISQTGSPAYAFQKAGKSMVMIILKD